jgi:hypothetical protein
VPGRVDVRAGVGYGRHLFKRGSLAPREDEILLRRSECTLDPVEPFALVREVVDLRLPGLVRSVRDDADTEVYHLRKGKAVRLGVGLGCAHHSSLSVRC